MARRLEALGAFLGLAWLAVLIWERFDPEGPQRAVQNARDAFAEYQGYREAMERTLAEIDRLPEADG